jgi:diguanylate cyclase (GGDEF)-like protein
MVHAAIRWVDGRLAHVVSSIDITENKYNEMLVRRLAECDTLTSLPNRGKLVEDMNGALTTLEQTKDQGYLIFLDLDDFKQVNDTLGHLAGDALLRQIGHFLQNESAVLGMPYRYGGDEFVIIAANKTAADLDRIRDLLLQRFALEWHIDEQPVFCGVSIGAVRIPQGNKTADELVHAADMAMYEVKKSGKHGFRLSTLEQENA